MKNVMALTGLVILSGCAPLMGATAAGDDPTISTITNVLLEKERDGLKYAHIVIDNEQIVSVHLHGFQYISALKKIDTKGCPEKFRAAWVEYIAAWQRKLNQEHATMDTADAISMWKGGFDDLPATVRCIEAYDTAEAWQHCERAASECGVDVSKLNIR
jgi:hypothetical protein